MELVISCLVLLLWADMPEYLWNGVPQNEEDLSYMLDDETTPVKACGDLAYHVNHRGWFSLLFSSSMFFEIFLLFLYVQFRTLPFMFVVLISKKWISDNRTKEPEEPRESFSQVKRRRMLQFDTQAIDPSLSCDELSSSFLKSNVCSEYLFSCLKFNICKACCIVHWLRAKLILNLSCGSVSAYFPLSQCYYCIAIVIWLFIRKRTVASYLPFICGKYVKLACYICYFLCQTGVPMLMGLQFLR